MLRRFRHGIRTVRAFGRIPPKPLPEPILALRSQRRRRTALPRQTARARASIPASQDKTSGTSPRPVSPMYRRRSSERAHVSPFTASPAHRRNPSDTHPHPVHSGFAALLPSQASARPRPRKIISAARPRHIKQLPARVQPGRELRFQRLRTKLPALRAARYHLCTAAALPNAPTCLRSQRRLRAAGILPIRARATFTATSPRSSQPGIRSPTPTQNYTRRTTPSRQTALRTHAPRARASIPASWNKTPGTSRRPVSPMYRRSSSERAHVSPFTASPARRRNPSDTHPHPVHSDFAALLPARHPLAHAHARLYPPHGPLFTRS